MSVYPHPRRRPILKWARWILFVTGIGLVGYVGVSLLDATVFQTYEGWQLDQTLNTHQQRSAATGRSQSSIASSSYEARGSTIAPGSVLGRIQIDRLGVNVVLMEGTSNRTLRRAVGHITGTALPGAQGNVGIAGHRDTYFRALRNVQANDEVLLTTLDGVFVYRVDSVKVVAPEDTAVLDDSHESILTLVTCYPFYLVGPAPKRFVVRAHRV